MPQISIIIPVRNRQACTQHILSQLFEQISLISGEFNCVIIVIDDGSTDGTPEMIKKDFPQVHLLEGDGNLWWTGAMVRGMQYALEKLQPDYILWLNDDISLADNFILNLKDFCLNPQYQQTIVGGIVRDNTYPNWIVYSGFHHGKPIRKLESFQEKTALKAEVLPGNMVLIPRTIVDKIGLPNARILPHNGGDYEYTKRAIRQGFSLIMSSQLQSYTNFTADDLVRYMPYWMQWYLQPNWSIRYDIIKGLSSRKSNHNVEHFVNLPRSKTHCDPALPWDYMFCYLNRLTKLILVDFVAANKLYARINRYFEEQQAPPEIIQEIKRKYSIS